MSRNSRPVERVVGSLSSLKSMARNAGPNPGKSLLCSFSFNLAFQIEFCSLFSLLFVCPWWFIFPFFFASLLLMLCLSQHHFPLLVGFHVLMSLLVIFSFPFPFLQLCHLPFASHVSFHASHILFCLEADPFSFYRQGQRQPQQQYHHRRMG